MTTRARLRVVASAPAKAVRLLAAAGRSVKAGTIEALARVTAVALRQPQFLEERRAAELTRRWEELQSTLLAALGHDLRTPLAVIRVAASNLQESWLADADRREQSDLIVAEVERLSRVVKNVLEMAGIDAGAFSADVRWVHPSEIVEAARHQVEHSLQHHPLDIEGQGEQLVQLDPRLTTCALVHVLENAAQYTPANSPIRVHLTVWPEGLAIQVRDHGAGIASVDFPHLFDRFYRGREAKHRASGTGMGLSIARGMLAVERGRIWAENCVDGGALFTMVVPAAVKSAAESL